MKKLFATIMVVIFVLCANFALAVGWDLEPAKITSPCTIGISLYEYTATAGYGGSYFKPFSGTVQKGTMIRVVVTVNVPDGTDVSRLSLDVIPKDFNVVQSPAASISVGKNEFMYVGYPTEAGASFKAVLKYRGLTIAEMPRITAVDGGFWVDNVCFACDSTGKIHDILYNGKPLGRTLNGELDLTEAELKDFQRTMNYLGFKLNGEYGYMTEAAIISHFGGAWEIGSNVQFSVGAPSAAISPAIPQTGEMSATALLVCGFLMVFCILVSNVACRRH